MTIVSGTMVFLVIWWVILFMVLPFGVRMDEDPQQGFATSAPKNPNLRQKFLITTILAGFIWALIQFVMVNKLISFS